MSPAGPVPSSNAGTAESLQARFDAAASEGRGPMLLALGRALLAAKPTLAAASAINARVAALAAAGQLKLAPCSLFALRSFTVEPLFPLLRAHAATEGISLSCAAGEFNAWQQEILDPASALYQAKPDVIVLALQARDLLPELWNKSAELPAGRADELIAEALGTLRERLSLLRERTVAQVLVFNFVAPAYPPQGFVEAQSGHGVSALVQRFNAGLRALCGETGARVFDYDGLVSRHGRLRWLDEKKWLTARMPIAADCLPLLAEELLHALVALRGRTRKVAVVDLDNTLWGGIVGEDGPHGIKLSAEYPGAAYQALQQALRDLAARGVLLAIASKNNPADALEVIDKHPGMLLRARDFAAMRINWNDKAQSLRELAAELNLGVDSLVFLDDNPVERERVRGELPEVAVLELPADPIGYADALRRAPFFARAALTDEDRARAQQYAAQRERAAASSSAGSVEEFLRSLSMTLSHGSVSPQTLARVAQLTQKTNQFNLTTRRYTEEEIAAFARDPRWAVRWIQVTDKFGDNGIIGVTLARTEGAICTIDSFLMSCRVIGRTVEDAMLALLANEARAAGATRLHGLYLPTAKNVLCKEFYRAQGFTLAGPRDGGELWTLELGAERVVPPWIEVTAQAGNGLAPAAPPATTAHPEGARASGATGEP